MVFPPVHVGLSDTPIERIGERVDCVGVNRRQRFELHQRELVAVVPELVEHASRVAGKSMAQGWVRRQPAKERLDIPVSHAET